MMHEVKSWPEFFQEISNGKPFDVRKNDRRYTVGDTLRLREYDDRKGSFTGRVIDRRITYIQDGVPGGIPPLAGLARGYSVLGLIPE